MNYTEREELRAILGDMPEAIFEDISQSLEKKEGIWVSKNESQTDSEEEE